MAYYCVVLYGPSYGAIIQPSYNANVEGEIEAARSQIGLLRPERIGAAGPNHAVLRVCDFRPIASDWIHRGLCRVKYPLRALLTV